MRYWIYDIATTAVIPALGAYCAVSAKYRPLLGRLRPELPAFDSPPLWVHACSVGETAVAEPLLRELSRRAPDVPRLLTSTTLTGRARAETLNAVASTAWFPVDHRGSVRGFLGRANPRALVLIETELWPNVLRWTARSGCPIVLVNGRISDRHFRRYQRLGAMMRGMLDNVAAAGVQEQAYANRLAELGMDTARIHVTGNIKFDSAPAPIGDAAKQTLRERCGIPADAPVLVFGSTRPGDEAMAANVYQSLREDYSGLRLVVAPRHIERADEAAACLENVVRWSVLRDGTAGSLEKNPILVDTHGDLASFYGIATVSVVGGSFSKDVQGHNPIEPASMGSPVVFGPYMRNFAGAADALAAAGAALQVGARDELAGAIRSILGDDARRRAMAGHGRSVVAQNRGALQRTMELLESVPGVLPVAHERG